MSTIVLANDVPSNIDTLERHLAWAGQALAFVNPSLGVLETAERAEKVAQVAIFQAADNTYRMLIRACLPVSTEYMVDRTKKIWMHVDEVSNTAVPAGFKAN